MLSDCRINEIKKFLKAIKVKCKNLEFIDKALTHSSYIFENNLSEAENYEKLEFLGDAVLKLCISKYLFDKFPDYNEGELTQIRGILISDKFLAKLATDIGLGEYLNLGLHEEKTGGRKRSSILACAFEALLGALYEEGLMQEVYKFIETQYSKYIEEIVEDLCTYNAKAILQEYTQSKNKDLPKYTIKKETGKAHDKSYEIEVRYNDKLLGKGMGKSKKEAEQNAALNASIKLGLIEVKKCQKP